jgi:hypothetical protein
MYRFTDGYNKLNRKAKRESDGQAPHRRHAKGGSADDAGQPFQDPDEPAGPQERQDIPDRGDGQARPPEAAAPDEPLPPDYFIG